MSDWEEFDRKLKKRGFQQTDALLHECPSCHERAVAIYAILGKQGGRDIRVCRACGVAQSWRSPSGMETRELDTAFDLRTFLR